MLTYFSRLMSKEATHRMCSQVYLHVSYPARTRMAFIGLAMFGITFQILLFFYLKLILF